MIGRPAGLADNQTYYCTVGQGVWRGHFTLYLLNQQYTLDSDGKGVVVNAKERFGPAECTESMAKA